MVNRFSIFFFFLVSISHNSGIDYIYAGKENMNNSVVNLIKNCCKSIKFKTKSKKNCFFFKLAKKFTHILPLEIKYLLIHRKILKLRKKY